VTSTGAERSARAEASADDHDARARSLLDYRSALWIVGELFCSPFSFS